VKIAAELHLPARFARWVPPQPWLQVRESERALLKLNGREAARFRLLVVPSGMKEEHLAPLLPRETWGDDTLVVISPLLKQSVRRYLEERSTCYLDSKGHLHLVTPGALVHLEGRLAGPVKKKEGPGRIGVHGVRTVQALLEQQEPISVSQLAEVASVSMGQAHKVLTQLEHLGLVRAFGSGPTKRRTVRERTALLDWLEQQPSATRWEPSLNLHFYARHPEELWSQVSAKLELAQVAHALTGAAAASLYGVGPTSVPYSLVRIEPDVRLDQAAEQLGAEMTDRGANLTLLQDTGKVGSWRAVKRDGIHVAPAARIYLDVRSERRGEDIAQQFREVVLGY
jgi:hypothetical protein